MDAEGQVRWVVDYIVGHEDSHREITLMARFPPEQDTWESRSSLLCEISYVVRAYKLMESSHPVLNVSINAIVVNESDEATHDVGSVSTSRLKTLWCMGTTTTA